MNDPEFFDKLILSVQKRRSLYDKRDKYFYNKLYKERLWSVVAAEVGRTSEECKTRWVLMRERFSKELRRSQTPSGSCTCTRLNWPYMEALGFLKDHTVTKCNDVDNSVEPAAPFPVQGNRKYMLNIRPNVGEADDGKLIVDTITMPYPRPGVLSSLAAMDELLSDVPADMANDFIRETYKRAMILRKHTVKRNSVRTSSLQKPTTETRETNLKSKRRKRRFGVKPVNWERDKTGFFQSHFLQIKANDPDEFFKYTRMTSETYSVILNLIKPYLIKTCLGKPIEPECRLAVLLFHLAQGTNVQSLSELFKLGKETVRSIILETSTVLWKVLSPEHVAPPTQEKYKNISEDSWDLWKLPNCVGAIDGRQIPMKCPSKGASQSPKFTFSNKKDISLALLAACDANCRFIHVDLTAYETQSDGGIFEMSEFGKGIISQTLDIPPPSYLPGTEVTFSHYFIGDAAFRLSENLMVPFPGEDLPPDKHHYNEMLSRANRTIENAFGVLASRWQILQTTFHMVPENIEKLVLACVALHNFMLNNEGAADPLYCPPHYIDWEDSEGNLHGGKWRENISNDIQQIRPSPMDNDFSGTDSSQMREDLANFLFNDFNNTWPWLSW